jgi:hypothetical protein
LFQSPCFFFIRDEPAVACEPSADHGAENEVDRAEERVPPGANQPGNFRWAKLLFDGFRLSVMNKNGMVYYCVRIKIALLQYP